MLCPRSFQLGKYIVLDEYMTPIDIQVSRSKVSVEGQAYSLYVGEGGHYCFTNSYIIYSTFTNNKYVFISTAFSHTSTILAGYIKI